MPASDFAWDAVNTAASAESAVEVVSRLRDYDLGSDNASGDAPGGIVISRDHVVDVLADGIILPSVTVIQLLADEFRHLDSVIAADSPPH